MPFCLHFHLNSDYIMNSIQSTLINSLEPRKMSAIQSLPSLSPDSISKSRKFKSRINSLKSFMDLTPESKPEKINIDIQYHDPTKPKRSQPEYDAAVIGCGPSGLRIAEQASALGVRICCIDPDPLMGWPNNYGSWVDEFEELGLAGCFDYTWPLASVVIDEVTWKDLSRPYGRVSRGKLKKKLIEGCAENGVRFCKAKAWNVEHEEFVSTITCSNGSTIRTNLVIDASGFSTPFITHDTSPTTSQGYQIAHGILVEVKSHPLELNKMLLMDWRDTHLNNEPYLRHNNLKNPTFLYAMPLSPTHIFLEETSLVSRPALSYTEIKKRMVARLRHMGIEVKRLIEEEKCLIPMGGPLPKIPQSVMGFGGCSGLVHPSTGYLVARALKHGPIVASEMVECLGSNRVVRGKALYSRVWDSLWTDEMKREREFYRFGMETLLKLDLIGTRRFFDAFFGLDEYYWQGFLSSRLSLKDLLVLSLGLFGNASNMSRLDIVTKCPVPLARMVGNLAVQAV